MEIRVSCMRVMVIHYALHLKTTQHHHMSHTVRKHEALAYFVGGVRRDDNDYDAIRVPEKNTWLRYTKATGQVLIGVTSPCDIPCGQETSVIQRCAAETNVDSLEWGSGLQGTVFYCHEKDLDSIVSLLKAFASQGYPLVLYRY